MYTLLESKCVFKGPGWSPGKPRLGLIEEIPEVNSVHEFNDGKD